MWLGPFPGPPTPFECSGVCGWTGVYPRTRSVSGHDVRPLGEGQGGQKESTAEVSSKIALSRQHNYIGLFSQTGIDRKSICKFLKPAAYFKVT
jgi:hypothetical protein